MLKNITLLFFALICICNSAFSASINLSPHRAVYDLSLVKSGSDKTIKSASGRIALEFSGNICQGFSFLLRQITNISDGEGAHKRVDMRVQNWENAKGTDLKFKSITREGDQIIQQSEGRALRDDAGEVSLSLHRPHLLKVDMDGKALFPTAHIRKLIEIGEQGDNFFSTKAYDGGEDGTKIFDTTAIIGKQIPAGSELRVDDIIKRADMNQMRRWPVQISYFEQGEGERLPAYKLSYDLFENGISTSLMFNFGTLTLKGQLINLELLPMKPCKK